MSTDETASDIELVPFLKKIYTDPIIWVILIFGYILMFLASTALGAGFVIVCSPVYILLHDKFP